MFIHEIARKYENYCDKVKFIPYFNSFMKGFPHIIISLILVLFNPSAWIGIFLLGVFIPDLPILLFFIFNKKNYDRNWEYKKKNEIFSIDFKKKINNIKNIKKIHHLILLIVIFVVLLHSQYIIALSGLLHFFIDWLGF